MFAVEKQADIPEKREKKQVLISLNVHIRAFATFY